MQTIDSAKNRISLASLIWIIKHCVFYISFRDYGSVSAVVGKFTLSLSLSSIQVAARGVLFKSRNHVLQRALDQAACKALTFARIPQRSEVYGKPYTRTSFFLTSLACPGITTRNSNGTNLPRPRDLRSGGMSSELPTCRAAQQ